MRDDLPSLLGQLFDAIDTNSIDIVTALVCSGVDPNEIDYSDGYTPLGLAVELGRTAVVEVLLGLGADPNRGGIVIPTLEAVENGQLDILRLLIGAGGDANQQDEDGESAWAWAFRNNNHDAIEIMSRHRTMEPEDHSNG